MDILFYHIFEKEKLYAAIEDDNKTRFYIFEKDYLTKPTNPWILVENKETKDIVSLLVRIGHESIIDPKTNNAEHLISFMKQVKKDLASEKNLDIYKKCSKDIEKGIFDIHLYQKENDKFDCNKYYYYLDKKLDFKKNEKTK